MNEMAPEVMRDQQVLTHIGSLGTREKFIRLDEGRLQGAMTRIDLSTEAWEDFGRPSELTITIEPGNRLG